MYEPKTTKYRKQMRRVKSSPVVAKKGSTLGIGQIGLQATSAGLITSRQIEAARKTISRSIKHIGKTYVRMLADKPMTALGTEVKLGKGKGAVKYWVYNARAGKMLYEIKTSESNLKIAADALNKASYKLSIKTRVIT